MTKVACITGGRRGIGLASAKALANSGYRVIITGTSPSEENQALLKSLRSQDFDFTYLLLDITNPKDRQDSLEKIIHSFGRIDLLVNNAGIAPAQRCDILETSEESYDQVLAVNLKGTYFMCQLFAKTMIELKKKQLPNYDPRIININSLSAYAASTNRGEYCVSKAGLSMVTDLFALRLASEEIKVFEIQPGIIETDMTSAVIVKYQEMIDEGLTPIKRLGQPEDIAKAIVCLCSGQLDFATGQKLQVDGGFHIRKL